jgi:hypothetical protein
MKYVYLEMFLESRNAGNVSRPQQYLVCLRLRRCPSDLVTPFGDHRVQRLNLFISDAGLGDLDQIKRGLRVDNGEETDHVARGILGFKGLQSGIF